MATHHPGDRDRRLALEQIMSISGLVVTLADEDVTAESAVTTLRADARLTLGERFGRRLAIVADTSSVHDDRVLWDELREMPGVVHVDVTFVHLDADLPEDQRQDEPAEDHRAHS
jgi:hypothetical protein